MRVLEGLTGTYFHKRLHIKVLKSESLVLIARFSRFAPPFLAMVKKEFIRAIVKCIHVPVCAETGN